MLLLAPVPDSHRSVVVGVWGFLHCNSVKTSCTARATTEDGAMSRSLLSLLFKENYFIPCTLLQVSRRVPRYTRERGGICSVLRVYWVWWHNHGWFLRAMVREEIFPSMWLLSNFTLLHAVPIKKRRKKMRTIWGGGDLPTPHSAASLPNRAATDGKRTGVPLPKV